MVDSVDGAPSGPGVADPIQERMDDIKYPTWQPDCRAVMLEIEPTKVREKFAVAEAAMAKRLGQLASPADELERQTLISERDALTLAVDEILAKHPELKK
jgi:hypothetical protein